MAVRGRGSYRECLLEVSYSGFPELVRTSGTASSIASGLTTYHPANCVVAILSNSMTSFVSCTRMLKTAEKRKMKLGVPVLLWSTAPIFASPFQVLLNFKIEFVIQSLSFVGICTIFPRISLHGILVFSSTACLADSPLYHADTPDCCICLVVQQALRERYQSVRCGRDIVQTHRSNQWFFWIFYIPNRFPIDPKHSQKLSFFLVAARSASFAL